MNLRSSIKQALKGKPASIVPLMRVMDMISAAKPWSKRFPKFKPRLVDFKY